MKQIKVFVIPPEDKPSVLEIDAVDLQAMQAIVGGYIERHPMSMPGLAVYWNEEGRMLKLPLNIRYGNGVMKRYPNMPPLIAGTVFVAREVPPDMVTLTDDDVRLLTEVFS